MKVMAYEGLPVLEDPAAILEQNLKLPQMHEIDKLQDECGVFAIKAPEEFPAGSVAWEAGVTQEHRGHSGSGMAYVNPKTNGVVVAKGLGRLCEAIPEMKPLNILTLKGNAQRGDLTLAGRVRASLVMVHNRYSTAPSDSPEAAQPFIQGDKHNEVTLGQNGNLANDPVKGIDALARKYGVDPSAAETDTEVLTMVVAEALQQAKVSLGIKSGDQLSTRQLGSELSNVLARVNGSYCLTIFYNGKLIGARDPWGVHPLSLGTFPDGRHAVIASETVALKPVENITPLESVRDFKPGELIINDTDGIKSFRIPRKVISKKICKFEYIYTADEESIVNGVHVRSARHNMGKHLAEVDPVQADMIVGVPSTGLPIAEGYAEASGIPKVDAIIKSKDAPRTFHLRGEERKRALAEKFLIDADDLKNKSIILIDDSTIKGNTARQLIQQLRDAGAREVHFRLASEAYVSPCNLGMDTSDISELIARGHTNQEIAKALGADSIAYNNYEGLTQSIDDARVDVAVESVLGNLCMACSNGDYSDGIVPEQVAEERWREAALAKLGQLAAV